MNAHIKIVAKNFHQRYRKFSSIRVYQIFINSYDNTHRVRRGVLRIRIRRVRGDSRRGEQLSGSRTGGGPRRGGGSRHTSCGAPRCGAGSGSRGGGCAPNKAVNEGPRMCPEKAPCL